METKNFNIILITLLLCTWVSISMAGITGKITGMVKDAKTGEALPGVNIVLEGTQRGAMTDLKGYYVILSVEPGTYSLSASMMGYTKETKIEVKVLADLTTTVNFGLKPTVIQMEEVVVKAERPPVEPDKTSTRYTVTADDIKDMSIIRNTNSFVALQPGVALDGTNRIRGSDLAGPNVSWYSGRGNVDVKVSVDGVTLVNYDGKNQPTYTGFINKSGVQEVTVETGVAPAEYGNANGGIINVVTSEGAKNYRGWLEYTYIPSGKKHWGTNVYDSPLHRGHVHWDDPEWVNEVDPETGRRVHQRTDYTGINGYELEGSLSGPIPFLPNVSFFASGKHSHVPSPLPSPAKHGFLNEQNNFVAAPNNFQGLGSLTWRINPNMKLKFGSVYQHYKAYNSGLDEGGVKGVGDDGKNIFLPENESSAGMEDHTEQLFYAAFTHELSPKTYYDLRLAYSRTRQDTIGVPTVTTANRRDKDGWFNIGRKSAVYWLSDRKRMSVKFDLTSQITRSHMLKTGFELIRWDAWTTQFDFTSPSERRVMFYAPFLDVGKGVNPIQGALYLQDKMEFGGMIVNAGIRLDYFNTNSEEAYKANYFAAPMWSRFTRAKNMPTKKFDPIVSFSPRIGIAHPITERAVVHFAYGVFLQYPDLFYYYGKSFRSYGQATDADLNGNGRIDPAEKWNMMRPAYSGVFGNPAVRPEKSTNFELGADYNFYTDYTASLVAFYKVESDQYTQNSVLYFTGYGNPEKHLLHYQRDLVNSAWGDTKGLEFSLRKRFSQHFAFSISYDMQWSHSITGALGSHGCEMIADSNFVRNGLNANDSDPNWYKGSWYWYRDFKVDPKTGAEIPVKATQEEVETYGAKDQNLLDIRRAKNSNVWVGSRWGEMVRRVEGPGGDLGLWYWVRGDHGDVYVPKGGDMRHYGSFELSFSTPAQWNLGPKWLGGLISNLHGNVIYTLESGTQHRYYPLTGPYVFREGPIRTNTDLMLEKRLLGPKSKIQPSLFVTITNLFNQQDSRQVCWDRRRRVGTNYTLYGIEGPEPTDETYQQYGNYHELEQYYKRPRQVIGGIRLAF